MGLKEKLLKEKIDSMKQLDRIELQNRVIMQQSSLGSWTEFYILGIVCMLFTFSCGTTISYLSSYGLNILPYINAIRIFSILSMVFVFMYLVGVFSNIIKRVKFKKELEDFIEEKAR